MSDEKRLNEGKSVVNKGKMKAGNQNRKKTPPPPNPAPPPPQKKKRRRRRKEEKDSVVITLESENADDRSVNLGIGQWSMFDQTSYCARVIVSEIGGRRTIHGRPRSDNYAVHLHLYKTSRFHINGASGIT